MGGLELPFGATDDVDELNVENESGMWWNYGAKSACA